MDAIELRAKEMLEAVTGRKLVEWDVQPRQGAVDFRCLDAPTLSLEIKQVTEQDFHTARARLAQVPSFTPSSILVRHWHVMLHVPTNHRPASLIDMRDLPRRLERILAELEQRKIFGTSGNRSEFDFANGRFVGPIYDFMRTCGGQAIGHQASSHMPAGIQFAGTWGHVCQDDPNVLADLVACFLVSGSSQALNLRAKLQRSSDPHRHACLVLTEAIDEAWLFDRWDADHLPNVDIDLPPEIDCLWIMGRGSTVWRFDRRCGWSSCARPAAV